MSQGDNAPGAAAPAGHAILSRIALFAVLATMAFGILVPIYVDEVAWRYQNSRMLFDGGVDRVAGASCGEVTTLVAPFFMQPVRYASALIGAAFENPLWIRLFGIAVAMLWVGMVWRWIARLTADRAERDTLRTVAMSLLGLGWLPLLMIWSRPEQLELMCLMAAMLLATMPSRLSQLWRSVLIVVLGAMALSYSPKGIVYMPAFAAAIAVTNLNERNWRVALPTLGVLVAFGVSALHYWSTRLTCPGNAALQAWAKELNAAEHIFGPGGQIDPKALLNLIGGALPNHYLELAAVGKHAMSDWMPVLPWPGVTVILWGTIMGTAWFLMIALSAIALVSRLIDCARNRTLPSPALLMAMALALCAALWGMTQLARGAYEAALTVPIAVLVITVALSQAPPGNIARRMAATLTPLVFFIAIGSQIALVAAYARPLMATVQHPGYIPNQRFSIVPFGYAERRAAVLATARLCNIPSPDKARGVLLDELSYFPYLKSYRPYFRVGVLENWGHDIPGATAFLEQSHGDGAIMACSKMPAEWRARARANGDICCVPKFGSETAAPPPASPQR